MYKIISLNHLILPRPLQSIIRMCRNQSETLYDILRLPRNCTNQEIRDSFVHLTKKFHPDVSGARSDPKLTAQFVKISEAYQILSKPQSRNAYDRNLYSRIGTASSVKTRAGGLHTTESHQPWQIKHDIHPNPGPYYGINGLNRISNSKIAWVLILFGVFGAIFGFASVNHTFELNRHLLDEKTARASMHHAKVRAEAEQYGNEEQLRRMVKRMATDEPK